MKRLLTFLLVALFPTAGWGQATVLQGGSYTSGRVPMYSGSGSPGQPTVQQSAPASGGAQSVGELSLIARGIGTAPYTGQGSGFLGSIFCAYDAPTSGPYHQLCLSPGATGGTGLISYNAFGGATAQTLRFNVNGQTFDVPAAIGSTIATVTNVTELAALTTRPAVVYAIDCSAGNDRKGGLFNWVAGSSATVVTCNVVAPSGGGDAGRWFRDTGFGVPVANGVIVSDGSTILSNSTTLPSGLAMGTPASINLTNGTALPSTGVNYTAPYTGSVLRTQTVKNADIISVKDFGAAGNGVTDDTVAVQAAVTAALAAGAKLYFPDGSYLTSATINNLHAVTKWGRGAITTATSTFYVEPTNAQTVTLYVGTAGSNANDCLAAIRACLTLQGAFNILPTYAPRGQWVVSVAAGTYGGNNVYPDGWRGSRMTIIKGPDVGGSPNVPTAIFDGVSTAQTGLEIANGFVRVKDLKFQNYSLGGSGAGVAARASIIAYENVHTFNNGDGLYNSQLTTYFVSGGKCSLINGNNSCILSLMNCAHTIGRDYDDVTGAVIAGLPVRLEGDGTGRGFQAQEGSTGHFRGNLGSTTIVKDFAVGIELISRSRVNIDYSDFRQNGVGVQAVTNSDWSEDLGTNVWNYGTADANTVNWRRRAGSIRNETDSVSAVWGTAESDLTTYTLAGSTAEQYFKVFTLSAGDYMASPSSTNAGRVLRVVEQGAVTGTADIKTCRFRLNPVLAAGTFVIGQTYIISTVGSTDWVAIGAASSAQNVVFIATGIGSGTGKAVQTGGTSQAAAVIPAATAGSFDISWTMAVVSPTAQKTRSSNTVSTGVTTLAVSTGSYDFSTITDQGLTLSCQLANAADGLSVSIINRDVRG